MKRGVNLEITTRTNEVEFGQHFMMNLQVVSTLIYSMSG